MGCPILAGEDELLIEDRNLSPSPDWTDASHEGHRVFTQGPDPVGPAGLEASV